MLIYYIYIYIYSYYNRNGDVVYMAAAVGIILHKNSNTQKFFGGGQIELEGKGGVERKTEGYRRHSGAIMALAMSIDRMFVATGELEYSLPRVYVWDTQTANYHTEFELPENTFGVSALAFNNTTTHLAVADLHADHNIYIYALNGDKHYIFKERGGLSQIFDIAWSRKENDMRFISAGINHAKFWFLGEAKNNTLAKFKGNGPLTTFICATMDDDGNAFVGGMNGLLYKFGYDFLICTTFIGRGPVHTVKYVDQSLITGSYDHIIRVHTLEMEEIHTFDCESIPRGVDKLGDNYLVGGADGSIKEYTSTGVNILMEGHCKGEVWGLDVQNNKVITCGDDNKLQVINYETRKLIQQEWINPEPEEPALIIGIITRKPPDRCGRCVTFDRVNGNVALALNNGHVQIREGIANLGEIKYVLMDSHDWIEVLEYSPAEKYLAVGSHDSNIYIYDVRDQYKLVTTITRHHSYITAIDWSTNEGYLRSNCGGNEVLYFNTITWKEDVYGSKNTRGVEWYAKNNTSKFEWNLQVHIYIYIY